MTEQRKTISELEGKTIGAAWIEEGASGVLFALTTVEGNLLEIRMPSFELTTLDHSAA